MVKQHSKTTKSGDVSCIQKISGQRSNSHPNQILSNMPLFLAAYDSILFKEKRNLF